MVTGVIVATGPIPDGAALGVLETGAGMAVGAAGVPTGDAVAVSGAEPESPNNMESTSEQPDKPTPATSAKAPNNRDETLEIAARRAHFPVIAALQIRPHCLGGANIQPACAFGTQGLGKSYPPLRLGTRAQSAAFWGVFRYLEGKWRGSGDQTSWPNGALAFLIGDE